MTITRKDVAQQLIDFLHHRLTLAELVDWAEKAMMEAEFDGSEFETLRDIISRIGLSNVKGFGMSWVDCEKYLSQLGYRVNVIISEDQAITA
jgi:hypothetical protein